LKAYIQGIGTLGGFGRGLPQLEQALVRTKTPATLVSMNSASGKIKVPALLADTADLVSFVGSRALRRLDHYIRMALLGSFCALEDAGILENENRKLGIIVATGYGATCNTFDFQNSMITSEDPCGSPTKFSNSVHNAAAGNISILLNETGPNLSVSHFDMSFASAMVAAMHWLNEGRVDTILIGGVDEYCKVLGYYWHCNRGVDTDLNTGTMSGISQSPATIGEGACFFVLTTDDPDNRSYGRIDTVELGNILHGSVRLPKDAAYILGVDEFSPVENRFFNLFPSDTTAACYAPVYGGIPVGQAFDLAIAALSIRRKRFYGSMPNAAFERNRLNLIKKNGILNTDRICCLHLGTGGSFGLIVLNGQPS
jgi:3-oxoacyl-[acyl-carrier-protein] synthase II